ncbi:MAG: DUF4292 domain-containing protein [Bacteroidales bacterium]|nr:DUF4292 domain-containing protein [Bacteroidales bacterium]
MNRFILALYSLLFILSGSLAAYPQSPLFNKAKEEAVNRILSGYTPWTIVELNGKLTIPNLPMGIKPSVKLWMKRGEAVMVSVRAPLMGEVGRVELTPDSLLIVNKMKNTYCKESLADVTGKFPAGIEDLQSLLLARIALLDKGEFSSDDSSLVTMLQADDGSLMVVPVEAEQPLSAEYGFLTQPNGRLQALMVSIEGRPNPLSVIYDFYISGGHGLVASMPGSSLPEITLSFDKPLTATAPFASFKPDRKYKRLPLGQFLRSF